MKDTLGARKRVGRYLTTFGGWTFVDHARGPGIRPDGSAVSMMRGPLGLEAIVYSRSEGWVREWIRGGRGREMRFALFLTPDRKVQDTLALVPISVLATLTDAYVAQRRAEASEEMERRKESH